MSLAVEECTAPNAGAEASASRVGLSVVVPIGPGDEAWRRLLNDLESLEPADEVVLVGVGSAPSDLPERVLAARLKCSIRWVRSRAGRARQMNGGALHARGEHLWFLHCDSRITPGAVAAIRARQTDEPGALHYCDLRFLSDGPRLTWLNEVGARVRSRVLKMPFGDQGLSLSKSLWVELGGFDESALYGEDHLLVWAARKRGVPVRGAGALVSTSARRYAELGWSKATWQNLWRTWRQAVPEAWRLLCARRR